MTQLTDSALPVDQVIDRMRELQQGLPEADGVAVFNRMYLTVTELVRERLAATFFDDPTGVAHLDAVFARRYLAAVDASGSGDRPTACWRPLFELRGHPGIHPLQFALAGMNAHIEHDLPLSVLDTCRELGREPEDVEADYHRINDLLAQVEARVREELLPEPEAVRIADPLLHVVGVWSIDRARDAAWASLLGLWELQEAPLAYHAVAAALSRSVGMVSRALLTPLDGYGRPPAAAGSRP
ncbi:DUF5995 family protein [Kitasatospora atroaurantiaca]|uniref:Uncharacterized protein n=1 Tax=Kitasatospora atroaurantiaca TaxID=285545 RepID=A0A561EZP9_9ACTN|nr:DUF5995 family protein [Kitasatospora atroaurantiaca]TWE21089.1 hypothetical protein FB465_6256 [Kitasatospora atroaurantiaca]